MYLIVEYSIFYEKNPYCTLESGFVIFTSIKGCVKELIMSQTNSDNTIREIIN